VLAALDLATFGPGAIVGRITDSLVARFAGSFSSRRTQSLLSKAANSIRDHLKVSDVTAAKKELAGQVVARKADGTPFDHVGEVREPWQCDRWTEGRPGKSKTDRDRQVFDRRHVVGLEYV
jgi:hypothetical protein